MLKTVEIPNSHMSPQSVATEATFISTNNKGDCSQLEAMSHTPLTVQRPYQNYVAGIIGRIYLWTVPQRFAKMGRKHYFW